MITIQRRLAMFPFIFLIAMTLTTLSYGSGYGENNGGATIDNSKHDTLETATSVNTIATVDSTGDVGYFTSITIGTDGLPVVSYYDDTNGDLKVLKCGEAACSSGNTITAVDTT